MNALVISKDFIFKGSVWKNCGATGAQKSALQSDQAFQKMMTGDYATTFAENQGLMKNLSTNLGQITNAGASQQGMSPQELAAQNSQAINAAAGSNQKIQTAIGEQNAGRSNATPGVESGIESAERAQAATEVDTGLNNTEANITQKNYDIGRQNYWNAVGETEKLPSAFESPSSQFAGEVTGANKQTSDQANQNAAADKGWMGLVSGLAGDATGLIKPR